MKKKGFAYYSRVVLFLLLMGGAISVLATPQSQKKTTQEENFKRPEPKGPTRPVMPAQNRYQKDKIFLEQADSLFRINLFEDVKIVKGHVKFRQGNTIMTCDSAYFYAEQDRAECFGNVRMVQGDTLFIYGDRLYYNGVRQFAKLNNGPTARKVRLINRKDTLIADSLNYNFQTKLGWYDKGGELRDPTASLTSYYGQYNSGSKNADFYRNVVLINRKDKYKLLTDTLYYNTRTGIARIVSRTVLMGRNDTVITSAGTYNTKTGFADLTRRSILVHKDDKGNVVTLEGDSIVYDRALKLSKAYRFRAPGKTSHPVVITDTANHSVLYGGYGYYDQKTRTSMATERPLLIEYSRPDSVFLRADTVRTFVLTSEAVKDSLGKVIEPAKDYYMAKAYNRARVYRNDVQGVADSITYVEIDSMIYLHRKPVVWSDDRQLSGEVIAVHFNDSTAEWVDLPETGLMMDLADEDFYNQLSAKKMYATLEDGKLKRLEAEGNVMAIMLPQESDSTYNKLVHAESSFLDAYFNSEDDFERLKMWPQVDGTVKPIGQVTQDEKFLRGAKWLEIIRPKRDWYGDPKTWKDYIGDITEELERYFRTGTP